MDLSFEQHFLILLFFAFLLLLANLFRFVRWTGRRLSRIKPREEKIQPGRLTHPGAPQGLFRPPTENKLENAKLTSLSPRQKKIIATIYPKGKPEEKAWVKNGPALAHLLSWQSRVLGQYLWGTWWGWLGVNTISFTVVLLRGYSLLSPIPQVEASTPTWQEIVHANIEIIEWEFNVPINVDTLDYHISVEDENIGAWEFDRYPSTDYARRMRFIPSQPLGADREINVFLTSIETPFFSDPTHEYNLEFLTHPLPNVIETSPYSNTVNIDPSRTIELTIDSPHSDYVGWNFEMSPNVEITPDFSQPELIRLEHARPFQQGVTYQLRAQRWGNIYDLETGEELGRTQSEELVNLSFTVSSAPFIQSFSPRGNDVLPTESIQLSFDTPMNIESVEQRLQLEPTFTSIINWNETATQLTIVPASDLQKATEYSFTLDAGAQTKTGEVLESIVNYVFSTVGQVGVRGTNPASGQVEVWPSDPIRIQLNQPVDQDSAEAAFSIRPDVQGTFRWEENTMIFQPQNAEHDTDYTIAFLDGIASIHGLNSNQTFQFSYRTAPDRFALDVPIYLQEEGWTCNIASARMLLAYEDINVSESNLKNQTGYAGASGRGNPYEGYVESYGTYWPAIEDLMERYLSVQTFQRWDLNQLLTQVSSGKPVMVWGHNGWSNPVDISWRANDGTYINAVQGMHSVVVIGYAGPVSNPTHIIVNDPWIGQRVLPTSKFLSNWSYFNVGLVVDGV